MSGFTNFNSKIGSQTLNNYWQSPTDDSMKLLHDELKTLRIELEKAHATPERLSAIGSVKAAEMAAQQMDKSTTMKFLKAAGEIALEVAKGIGATIAENAIKSALRM